MTQSLPHGSPYWSDVATPDIEGAKRFYAALFGWTFGDTQEELAGYTQAHKDGKAVAALYHLMPGMTTSVWSLYFAADDAEKLAAAIEENGGSIVSPVMDVMGLGKQVVAADPTGAVFGAWEAGTFAGAELFNEPGSLIWEDLRSTDPAVSRQFFSAVFGFSHHEMPFETPMDYQTFAHGGSDRPLGGMSDLMGATDRPSHWVVYFKVEDTPSAIETLTSAGGQVLTEPMQTPFGRQCMAVDPFGGAFGIIDSYTG